MHFSKILDCLLTFCFIYYYGQIGKVGANNGLMIFWILWVLVFMSCIYILLLMSFDFLVFQIFFCCCPSLVFVFSCGLLL
jgi:hypothetical protein